MENVKINHDFSKYKDADLETTALHIADSLTDNPNFTTPDPPLTELKTDIDAYSAALGLAHDGTKQEVSDKNAKRAVLENVLGELADYVQRTAANETIALSSGLELAKKHAKIGVLAKPENVKVIPGKNKGSVDISCDAVEHADYYEYQYTTDVPSTATSVWLTQTAKKHKVTIDGLASGKQYGFRVAGAGSDDTRVWSNEVATFVL